MPLLNWIRGSVSARQLGAMSMEVARRCQPAVALRLGQAMRRMSLPEARGYVRARAAAVLDDEMSAVSIHGNQPSILAVVRENAVEEIVRMSMADLLKATRPAVARQRAA